jgi:hypothetical protein
MSKLTRVVAKIFGINAGANQISKFGSLAASAPAFTTDPAVAQSLSNWLDGWFGAVVGGNSPAIEDMNSVHFVLARQIAYLMQEGVAEWDTDTTYFINSMAKSGGVIYKSLTDNNTGNAVTDVSKWKNIALPMTRQVFATPAGAATYTTPAGVLYLKVRMIGGGNGGDGGGTVGYGAGAAGAVSTFGSADSSDASPYSGFVLLGGKGGPEIFHADGHVSGAMGGSGSLSGSGEGGDANNAWAGSDGAQGSGGGGGGCDGSSPGIGGAGGDASSSVEFTIPSPAATYSMEVGAGGTGGTAGTSGGAGGDGGDGLIIVEEVYQ